MTDDITLFERSPEEKGDMGEQQFFFGPSGVLGNITDDANSGALDTATQGGRIGRIRIVGKVEHIRTGQVAHVDRVSNWHVITPRGIPAYVRAGMREEVAKISGTPRGAVESWWSYGASRVSIEWQVPKPPAPAPKAAPPKRPPPSKVFKKVAGKWQRKVKGYTRKDGKHIKGYTRKSSRAEVQRYRNA